MVVVLVSSCHSNNQLVYFEDLQESNDKVMKLDSTNFSLKIVPDDELLITVTSLLPEASAMYNLPMVNLATKGAVSATGNVAMQTYIVDSQGDIRFPMIGKIHVAGMTTNELTDFLVQNISKEVDDPIVRVEVVNFAINVMGEVKTPGRYNFKTQQVTVLDALATAGDLSEYGRRDNVLLVRRDGGKTIYHRFNLRDAESMNSPYFFLKQNDVIYVEADDVKAGNAKYSTNNSYKLSLASTIVSTISVIASLVIALTVR